MSGFFGMIRLDGDRVDERFLEQTVEAMRFRGPDGAHVWACEEYGGCFAFMETGAAPQARRHPMSCDGRSWLLGDVRLDGREALQDQLAETEAGLTGDATSEELLLCAWKKSGEACLDDLLGDFSFALWDAARKEMRCVRDFVGHRPFYYAQVGGVFCFSNTLQLLRRVPEVSSQPDETFIGDFLLQGWCADPARTAFRDIQRLPPGHLLKLSSGRTEVKRFYKLPIEDPLRLKRPQEYLERYRALLRQAVSDRLPGGPTALYLSGGLDSGSVCAMASEIAAARGRKEDLKAFTVSWRPILEDEEPDFAERTARHLRVQHAIFEDPLPMPFAEFSREHGLFPELSNEPFLARARVELSSMAAHSRVALSGNGGDNVLVGQAWPYLQYLRRRREWREIAIAFGAFFLTHGRIPPPLGGFRTRARTLLARQNPWKGYPPWLNEAFEKRARLRERWKELNRPVESWEHPVHPRAYTTLHSGFWGSVLEGSDAGCTGVLLESRGPLLDLRILRFWLRLPPVPWCANKELSRKATKNMLPEEVRKRPKCPLPKDPLQGCLEKGWTPNYSSKMMNNAAEFINYRAWNTAFDGVKNSLRIEAFDALCLATWLNRLKTENGFSTVGSPRPGSSRSAVSVEKGSE